ncbi:MAG: type II toxin-antitoxin system prevent-host-death family antitoxin [Elusimicrobiota bacterium]
MPIIKSISDLRNHANEISGICHKQGEPVFVTKNGKSDLVVMSQVAYEELESKLELYDKLEEARSDAERGDKGVSHANMMRRLKDRLE